MASAPSAMDLARLSVSDRLDLMDQIWATLAPGACELALPDWHVAEIKCRLAAFAADGNRGRPADEAFAELKRRVF